MKFHITIEKYNAARKSMPARWRVHAEATFGDISDARRWMEKQGLPSEPAPGWALRMACVP